MKYSTSVLCGGRVELPPLDADEGTAVEVIVLFANRQARVVDPLLAASETTLGFWENEVDEEVWDSAV